jgi:soluble lytic murein transglycosylase
LFSIIRFISKFLIIAGIILGLGYYIIFSSPVQKFFYPILYPEYVFSYAERYQIDPYLVAAVIRAESRFSITAESGSGARGLMQIMPDTAKWAADKMGLEFDREMLFEPEYNIRIGCWYLRQLLDSFQGNLIVVLASYNAGQGNVRKWMKEGLWDGRFASLNQIPFSETRLYVHKVIKYYQRYQDLYERTE